MGIKLGINGLGRIGKLLLWRLAAARDFDEIVVNTGRAAGKSLKDIAYYIERDSTYGSLRKYLYGFKDQQAIADVDDAAGTMTINGVKVTVLRKSRNPKDIGWRDYGVELVVDASGAFVDPVKPADDPKGALRGHLDAGAKKVILSAPFKIKDKSKPMPDDAVTAVMGINEHDYNPARHKIISAASCTTTCLAHMFKPLINKIGPKKILSASMATVHAATGSQEVLDRLAKSGDKDLRKNRSIFNNIILTTTGAADTLALVIPEMSQIGFIAESVRIPTTTGSLVILTVNIQEDPERILIDGDYINAIYKEAAESSQHRLVVYSDEQNVSCDIISMPLAAVVIEGHETHTRTAEITFDAERLTGVKKELLEGLKDNMVRIPLTQAVIYGWYDNEMGSYVNVLSMLTKMIVEDF
ncbi:type I glyceraldehyde-3-phosphate dehydrogenase [Candidatus Magnetominusculus xianensis]|uniref:Glyceraldehyde-3-phosphate dehydrogenase n=1 Tax=Candidatus Magnetominusculus xianensis TaxID=1748249 RepID=A0ABR5SFM8_9BACT|nr:glyceraldehyde 3-phosphate dehydrogenase NAD-binding domain-containing protein [Candidatus Magnetominusculus xianensis]KWT76839.1 glyceraldehyde-3-phosphate dehydrogenase [Candidatus Magnetominusculus xianensis]MBF0402655.1 glyceraldehyde-3-phosphate dehydrogenase [Nitrospirota bacterium]